MTVKFLDLSREYHQHQAAYNKALTTAIHEFNFIRGHQVREFEETFASKLGVNHVISAASGTDALYACLKMLGVGSGDEVITPAFSWISSAETITQCGAVPVFADVETSYYTIDPKRVTEKITKKTKGIVVVHLYGQMADVYELRKICDEHDIFLLEDCAQSHGAAIANEQAGSFGDVSAFSFYPTKNLGAYGDAGCVATNNGALAERLQRFMNHGALKKDDHEIEGFNSRMDTLQAAILLEKLPHLRDWNMLRSKLADIYHAELNKIPGLKLPVTREGTKHAFHLYVVETQHRDELRAYLAHNGVETLIHYPEMLPSLPAYRYMRHQPEDFPVSNELKSAVLSLPLYPWLKETEISYVCEKVKRFYAK